MDKRDEIRLSKGDTFPKKSSLPDSDQNKHRNKLLGIGRVYPMKLKSKVTVIKESDKVPAVKEKPIDVTEKSTVVKESDKASVVAAVVSEKSVVDEKDNPKVTSKVSKGKSLGVFKYKRKTELPKDNQKDNPKDKESDKAPVVAAVVSDESDKATVATPILKEKTDDVIEKSTIVKESDKAPIVKESDKVPVVKESDKVMVVAHVLKEKPADVIEKSTVVNEKEKPAVDVTSKVAKDKEKPIVDVMSKVGKSKAIVHNDKALDVVSKDKPKGNPPPVVGKGNATSVIGKAKNKPSVLKGKVPTELPKKKHKADIPKDKPKPKDKHKEDRSKKKLELKMIKGKMVSDEVDSDEVSFSSFHNVSIDKYRRGWEGIPVGGISLFSLDVIPIKHEFVRSWVDQFYPKLLKEVRVGDIASKIIYAQQVDFLFKVNFLTLFTNTMGRVAGLKGQICLDVNRRLREESVISEIDWCGYIYSCLEDSELPEKLTLHYLGPFTFLILLYLDSTKFDKFPVVHTRPAIRDWTSTLIRKRQDLETKEDVIGCLDLDNEWTESELQETEAKEKLVSICSERVVLEDLIRKASSDYTGDQKFVELQENYVQVFRDPISFDVDVNFVDGGNDSDGDDDGDDDNDDGNGNNDDELNNDNDDGNGNNDEELIDEDTLGRNPSFGFSKIRLDDFDKHPSQEGTDAEKESVDPTQEGTGDLFGDNSVKMEVSNQGPPTPDRMLTRASNASRSMGKRIVKPSSYLLSPYMNKKTKVVSKITWLEFSIENSLFAMQAPDLWIDANVIDCWGAVLNHEEKFRDAKSKSRHFFPPVVFQNLCLMVHCLLMMKNGKARSKSMFDGTLPSDDDKWALRPK
ncbi:hypothetical protein Tco_0734379 [Tanacetum coccineum]